jgi:hypothetical protein
MGASAPLMEQAPHPAHEPQADAPIEAAEPHAQPPMEPYAQPPVDPHAQPPMEPYAQPPMELAQPAMDPFVQPEMEPAQPAMEPAQLPIEAAAPAPGDAPVPAGEPGAVEPGPQAAAAPEAPLAGFLYSFQNGPRGEASFLYEGDNLVGRHHEVCSVVIKHVTTSLRHAVIHAAGGKVWLTCLGGTNGTFINGQRLQPHVTTEVQDGDTLRFGAFTCHVAIAKHRP